MLESFLDHPLWQQDLVLVVAVFTVFVLYIFGSVLQKWSNFLLCSMKVLLRAAYIQSNQFPKEVDELLEGIPTGIRTVAKHFRLTPILVIFATCLTCCATYAPHRTRDGFEAWPSTCTYRKFGQDWINNKKNPSCGQDLTNAAWLVNGRSVRHPSQPFPVQQFQDFVAGLVCRSGMEKIF
jgi:hypothetical protein